MENPFLKLLDDLEGGLVEIDQNHNSKIERCSLKLELCQNLFGKMRGLLLNHQFQTKEDEIHFFKKVKPVLASELHFQRQVFDYYKLKPKGSQKVKKAFLNSCQDKAAAVISDYSEFESYHLLKSTHLDELYFIRQEFNLKLHSGLKMPEDPEFSSPAEPTLSCLLAANRCVQFIEKELIALKNPKLDPSWEFMKSLNW